MFLLTATVSPYGAQDASRGREIRKLKNSSNLLEYLWVNAKKEKMEGLCVDGAEIMNLPLVFFLW